MKISFLTSGHDYNDDRIFYHQAKSLQGAGHEVEIINSRTKLDQNIEGINIRCFDGDEFPKATKIAIFLQYILISQPDIVICSEPLPIIAAVAYRKRSKKKVRIYYDITEWYPSKRNLRIFRYPNKAVVFFKLLFFNLLAASRVDGFIFGELYKSRQYRFMFPFKSYIFSTYYPDSNYIKFSHSDFDGSTLKLCHSGKMSRDNGYINFVKVVNLLASRLPDILIEVKVIGWFETQQDQNECEVNGFKPFANLSVSFYGKQPYETYISMIEQVHIFLDLRIRDFENQYSLPIKLFYYLALGRPVIYSNLKSIVKEVAIDEFGKLVDPEDINQIANIIEGYCRDLSLYKTHCLMARKYSIEKYNWGNIKSSFIEFVQQDI